MREKQRLFWIIEVENKSGLMNRSDGEWQSGGWCPKTPRQEGVWQVGGPSAGSLGREVGPGPRGLHGPEGEFGGRWVSASSGWLSEGLPLLL